MRSTLYKLNESNSNNPCNLLVGQDVNINIYDKDGSVKDSYIGSIEEITNEGVMVRDFHTHETSMFIQSEYNYKIGGVEFIYINNPLVKFIVFDD